jgi:hypothetical protein
MKSPKLVAAMMLFAGAALVLGSQVFSVHISAQTKTEICDNKIDDDGDGAIDEADTDCKKTGGIPCSPGYWKNHQSQWVGIYCDVAGAPACADLLKALTCRGSDSSCGRSAAAEYLNGLTQCTE